MGSDAYFCHQQYESKTLGELVTQLEKDYDLSEKKVRSLEDEIKRLNDNIVALKKTIQMVNEK